MSNKKKSPKRKCRFAFVISFGLMIGATKAFSQTAPPQAPPPPPSPGQVLNSINPFKKNKSATAPKSKKDPGKGAPAPGPGVLPPPPPNPLDLLKKKPVTPPAPPGT